MHKKTLIFSAFISLFLILPGFAQTPEKIEKELAGYLKEIEKYWAYGDNFDQDKLYAANNRLKQALLKYGKLESTLKYAFPNLKDEVFIATSNDGKFRIYSWDIGDGGTMHDYDRVYQFVGSDGKLNTKAEPGEGEGAGSFVHDIFSMPAKGGTVYMVCSTAVLSSQDHYQSLNLYRIAGPRLNDKVKLIRTKSGLTGNLSFGYSFFSVVDRSERPIRLFSFNKDSKTIKFPVVVEDEEFPNGRVTDKSIEYRFNGTNFVKVK